MKAFVFNIYSHCFTVAVEGEKARRAVMAYYDGLKLYDEVWSQVHRRKITTLKAVFAVGYPDGKTFAFPIQDHEMLMAKLALHGFCEESYSVQIHRPSDGVAVDTKLKEGVAPREEQVPIIKFMTDPGKSLRVLPLRTGGGKTISTLLTVKQLGRRAAFTMGAQHIITWLRSIEDFLDIKKDDICVVRGSAALAKLIKLSKAGENTYTHIFISQTTIRDFIKANMATGYTVEGVGPRELYQVLGVGIVATDEAHEAVHAVTLHAIHTHVSRVIYLSATLTTDDGFIQNQYDKIFPLADRYTGGKSNNHVDVYPVYYRLHEPKKAKFKGFRGYSHIVYEQWIGKDPKRFENYYQLIKHLIDLTYVKNYKEKQVLLVYAAQVSFCERLADRITLDYPDLNVSSYTASNEESVLFDNDVIVSTVGSCGTGKDIPNISTVVATVAIMSVQKNLQMLGRPRPMVNYPGQNPKYLYLNCRDIKSHSDYDKRKRQIFPGKCKSIRGYDTGIYV